MLDDNNILDQFYVRDHLNEYMASVDLTSKLSSASLVKPSRSKITKLFWVGEDGASDLGLIKLWLDNSKTSLDSPVALMADLKRSWLDKNTLVVFKPIWQNTKKRDYLYQLAVKYSQVIDINSVQENWLWQTINFLKQQKIVSQVEYSRFIQLLTKASEWAVQQYCPDLSISKNYAKQLALFTVGKTAVFTSSFEQIVLSDRFVENLRLDACNLAFSEELFAQMDRLKWGWSSHPIEKPFATFVVKYDYSAIENRLLRERCRQLSGLMPASQEIDIKADSLIEAAMRADALAYYMATYLAVLNKRSLKPYSYN